MVAGPDFNYRAVILLSAYGESSYLADQIKSITSQMTGVDLLVIVDDGSGAVQWDGLELLLPANYCAWSRLENIGSSSSFLDMLLNPQWDYAEFYFLSDQDDVWEKGKIEKQIKLTPPDQISVHSVFVDWLNGSGAKRQRRCIPPLKSLSPIHFFFETPAPGMTMCISAQFRERLKRKRTSLSEAALCLPHDRIIGGCAGWSASVVSLKETLVSYRQHPANQIGAAEKTDILSLTWRRIRRIRIILKEVKAGKILFLRWTGTEVSDFFSARGEYSKRIRQRYADNLLMKILIWLW